MLIAYLDASDAHHVAAQQLLEESDEDLGASVVTLAEVLVGPARLGRIDEAEAVLHEIGIEQLHLPSDAPRRLAELRSSLSLKLPDCCVLLAAEEAGSATAAAVATFDDRLARSATGRSLRIMPSG